MSSRRSRIVVKPNIRPAAPKIVPKAKQTPSISKADEHTKASPATATTNIEKSETLNVITSSVCPEPSKPTVPLNENSSGSVLETTVIDDDCIIVDNGKRSRVDINAYSERDRTDELSFNAGETNTPENVSTSRDLPEAKKKPKNAKELDQKDTSCSMQTTTLSSPVVRPSSPPSAVVAQNDACVPALVTKSPSKGDRDTAKSLAEDIEADPSEVASCISEAMSLESIEERKGELENEAPVKEKKIRRKRKTLPDSFVKEKSPDRQKMKIGDLLFWNPQQNFMPGKKKSSVKKESKPEVEKTINLDDDNVKDHDESTNDSESMPAPQVMIGPDGNIVLNNESLMIRNEKKVGDSPMEIVEEDADDRYLNYGTYRKTKRAKIWCQQETQMFYLGLSMCGTDFSLITRLMPHRTRKDLTNKFRREEKYNRQLIDVALARRKTFDPVPFEKVEDLTKTKPKLLKVPYKKSESKKDVKKESLKELKKEAVTACKKQKKPPKKKKTKKKEPISEDEEDVWPSDTDDEDCIELNSDDDKHREASNVKTEGVNKTQPTLSITNDEGEETASPKMKQPPRRTYSRKPKAKPPQDETSNPVGEAEAEESSKSVNKDGGIQAIPGSTQIQIDMGEKVMQGVLIPSKMVPILAPQLGIDNVTDGMQVVLVQEESASGSLVHVYIIPEGEGEIIPSVAGARNTTPAAQPVQQTNLLGQSDFDPTSPASVTFTPIADTDNNLTQTPLSNRRDVDLLNSQQTRMSNQSDFDPTSPSSVTFSPVAEADKNSIHTPLSDR